MVDQLFLTPTKGLRDQMPDVMPKNNSLHMELDCQYIFSTCWIATSIICSQTAMTSNDTPFRPRHKLHETYPRHAGASRCLHGSPQPKSCHHNPGQLCSTGPLFNLPSAVTFPVRWTAVGVEPRTLVIQTPYSTTCLRPIRQQRRTRVSSRRQERT